MKFNKKLAVAVSGAVLLMAGQIALADSTTDIVDALVSKGVLTEEEGKLISKGAKSQKEAQDKSIKGKLSISSALDNATVYGDIRVRYENRDNGASAVGDTFGAAAADTHAAVSHTGLSRARYKLTLGVLTNAGDWYSDLALAMGAKGRSDNANFGHTSSATSQEIDGKETLFVKRAMLGWKATDWLSIEAGRMTNPLYTSSMVWDADLNVEGLAEKFKYTVGNTDLFATFVQNEYAGVRKLTGVAAGADSGTIKSSFGSSEQYVFQAGLRQAFQSNLSGKAAVTHTIYTKNPYTTTFGAAGQYPDYKGDYPAAYANSSKADLYSINDLSTWEIPAEINYMATDNIGIRAFEHYVWNTDADARARNSGIAAAANGSKGSDDTAWMVGIQVASAKDLKAFEGNKMSKGDWSGRLWYQSTGAWALDAATIDSDIFDGRTNMEGTAFKGQYNLADNVLLNFTGAWAKKKNKDFYAFGLGDISGDVNKLNLYQFDVTYKF